MFKTQAPTMRLTLRVLAHLLRYPDAELRAHLGELADALQLEAALPAQLTDRLSNATTASVDTSAVEHHPCVASIYQLDGIVRRAPSLQLTADARGA